MIIQRYFESIKRTVDQYGATHFIIEAKTSFDIRPGGQGYLNGSIYFVDGSILYFKEFLDAVDNNMEKLMYSYHYQDRDDRLIFRYDNAAHKPKLPFREHKHLSNQILEAFSPTLRQILSEIFTNSFPNSI